MPKRLALVRRAAAQTAAAIALILASALALTGCESFLTAEPQSQLVQENYYETPDQARSAVYAIYSFVRSPSDGVGTFGETPYAMLEVSTGHYEPGVGQANFSLEAAEFDVSAESDIVAPWWEASYEGIEAANLAIANIPDIDMDDAEKTRLLGEARFLRAYFYFNLVRLFGDVPLKTTPTTNPADGEIAASPVDSVYGEVIVPDLQAAEEAGLPATSPEGRISEGAAKSLLAKVYLTMAGFPLQQTEMYAAAAGKAQEVIDGDYYALFESDGAASWFEKLSSPAFDYAQEHIFMANYAPTIAGAYLPQYLLPQAADITSGIEFNGLLVLDGFRTSYPEGDLRAQNQGFFYESITVGGQTYTFPWSLYKFFDESLTEEGVSESGKNFPILRYADLLLLYAEAQNEAEGSPSDAAYDAVNQIRARAGLAPVSSLSQSAFRQEVWRQRTWELTGENKTWFDMVRTRQVYDADQGRFVDFVGYTSPVTGATLAEKNYYFPVPLRELQTNDQLEQNPGY